MVEIVSNFNDIQSEWRKLYSCSKLSPFQSYEYNVAAYDFCVSNANCKLYILVYKDSYNTVKAVFPTCLISGILRFINDRSTDYCDCIIADEINLHTVFYEITQHIKRDKKIKGICFDNVIATSPILSLFKTYIEEVFVFQINTYSYISCIAGSEVYHNFKYLNSDKIKKLKKIRAKSEIYNLHVYESDKEDFPVNKLKTLADIMMANKMRSNKYYDAHFWDFLHDCYVKNLVEIAILENDNVVVSAGIIFHNTHMSVRWVILYIEPKYNLWNNMRYIVDKCNHITDTYEINFGRGVYDYKINNFKPEIGLLYRIEYSKSAWGCIMMLIKTLMLGIKPVVKKLLRR